MNVVWVKEKSPNRRKTAAVLTVGQIFIQPQTLISVSSLLTVPDSAISLFTERFRPPPPQSS